LFFLSYYAKANIENTRYIFIGASPINKDERPLTYLGQYLINACIMHPAPIAALAVGREKWSAWSLQRFAFDKWITCRLVS